jgi:DNA-binding response OmpR family regulator
MKHRNWILIVDDDSSVREMLTRVLAGEGYGVLSAGNGEEAVNIASRLRVDLALLDLNLPVQSGWDTFEKLVASDPGLPVIIITARSNQLFTALGAGVGALLEKPLDFPKLLQIIRELLAEPVESRLHRVAGRPDRFHYMPTREKQHQG